MLLNEATTTCSDNITKSAAIHFVHATLLHAAYERVLVVGSFAPFPSLCLAKFPLRFQLLFAAPTEMPANRNLYFSHGLYNFIEYIIHSLCVFCVFGRH